jgi:hypothetical protein
MNDLYYEIIKYDLNKFLNLNDKISLSLVNKKFNSIQKKTIFFHIGEIIANKIGAEDQNDYKIISKFKFDIMKEIVENIFERKQVSKIKNYGKSITLGNLLKIKSKDLEDCKKLLLENKLKHNNNYNSIYNTPVIFKKFFYLTYALI